MMESDNREQHGVSCGRSAMARWLRCAESGAWLPSREPIRIGDRLITRHDL